MIKNVERLLQLSIVLSCAIIISSRWTASTSLAQVQCNGLPQIKTNNHPDPLLRLRANSWLPGISAFSKRQIAVLIYDTSTVQGGQMNEGIQTWNSYSDCANVYFNAASQPTNSPSGQPPADTLWVTRGPNTQVFPRLDASDQMISANISIHSEWNQNPENALRGLLRHETGHTFGLNNAGTSPLTVMGNYQDITSCDTAAVKRVYCPSPSPTPTPPPPPGNECNSCSGGAEVQYCEDEGTLRIRLGAQCCTAQEQYTCILNGGTWDSVHCTCGTPIVLDVLGNGFSLTGAQDGVLFDLAADHSPRQLSWTSANSDDAWLALDRNGNGFIDNGRELFGSYTPQPFLGPDETKNGFRALAVFDRLDRGGNGDGRIDQQDAVFPNLMLWQDVNHNGVSEPNELHGVVEMGFAKIDLDYRESRRLDEHGNWFRFRSKVRDYQGYQFGRWAWDVFLQAAP